MTKRARLCCGLLVLTLAWTAGSASATVILPQNLEQIESAAQRVFVAVCTSATAQTDVRGIPITVYTFKVSQAVKGDLKDGGAVVVRQVGNNTPGPNGLVARIVGAPSYKVGQEVMLFLNPPSRIGLTAPVGLSQGVFNIVTDPNGNRQIVLDPVRRRTLAAGVKPAKYAATGKLSATEQTWLTDPPERTDVSAFCTLVRKISEERKRTGK